MHVYNMELQPYQWDPPWMPSSVSRIVASRMSLIPSQTVVLNRACPNDVSKLHPLLDIPFHRFLPFLHLSRKRYLLQ
jgi:hypothetical protein